jgi:hypothetical protein
MSVSRARSAELVPVGNDVCPTCGSSTRLRVVEEPALVRVGGYGATRRTVTAFCADECGWLVVNAVSETSPRRAAASDTGPAAQSSSTVPMGMA